MSSEIPKIISKALKESMAQFKMNAPTLDPAVLKQAADRLFDEIVKRGPLRHR